jgi:hypothetical protein
VLGRPLLASDPLGVGEDSGAPLHARTRFHLVPLAVSSITTPFC